MGKPGSVDQKPLFACANCYEECSWPASDLRVHEGECWCDMCWEGSDMDLVRPWSELEPFRPAPQSAPPERFKKAKALWAELSDIPVDDYDQIELDWHYFKAGTHREDIWHWFEAVFDLSVTDDLMSKAQEPDQ